MSALIRLPLSGTLVSVKESPGLQLNPETFCPFCAIDPGRIAFADPHIFAIWDAFPVSTGHVLIIPRRHVAGWEDLEQAEKAAVWAAIDRAMEEVRRTHGSDGFNVGFNQGAPAGQTVFHFHLHVIPRRTGDVPDPRGGVRHVIPRKANYLVAMKDSPSAKVSPI